MSSLNSLNRKEKIQMNSVIVGFGNTGNNIVTNIATSTGFDNVSLFSIDSVVSAVNMDNISSVKTIPIISDMKSGSGRDRNRGKAMYKFHEAKGSFDELYLTCTEANTPVFVVTSAAGGTGSGSVVPFCEYLIKNDIPVLPIIVCPNEKDPDAYHMNATDLLIELDQVGVTTYSVFTNPKHTDYSIVNKEIVEAIRVMLGKYYTKTDKDSIDDSDLDTVLSWPGRVLATTVTATSPEELRRNLTRRVFWGHQPGWDPDDKNLGTLITAGSLKSFYADSDFDSVFEDIYDRIPRSYDRYKHVVSGDNTSGFEATIIVAGLPRPNIKEISDDFNETSSIGDGMKKSSRPAFMRKKSTNFFKTTEKNTEDTKTDNISKFDVV